MQRSPTALPDPRVWGAVSPTPAAAALHRLAERSLAASSEGEQQAANGLLQVELAHLLATDGDALVHAVESAPGPALARHLYRQLDLAWSAKGEQDGTLLRLFVVPVVVVVGAETPAPTATLSGVIDPAPLERLLADGGALGGCRQFALASALVAPPALALDRLQGWDAYRRTCLVAAAAAAAPPEFPATAAPIAIAGGRESVHVRFLLGSALAAASAPLVAQANPGAWGMGFARELSHQLARSGVTVLALPRAPQSLLLGVQQGLAAQREVSAQLCVSNAVRRFRGATGEPTAIISAHVCADAPGGGELRLSLSTPFDPRDAEGFRCPLYLTERVEDVLAMLVGLLEDCRVTDIRLVGGVHADHVYGMSAPLLFKPDTLPAVPG